MCKQKVYELEAKSLSMHAKFLIFLLSRNLQSIFMEKLGYVESKQTSYNKWSFYKLNFFIFLGFFLLFLLFPIKFLLLLLIKIYLLLWIN